MARLRFESPYLHSITAAQQCGAVFEAHHGGRRLRVVALAGPAGGGGDWSSSSVGNEAFRETNRVATAERHLVKPQVSLGLGCHRRREPT